MVNGKRVKEINQGEEGNGPVVYWMSRDQRVKDNWALLYACQLAKDKKRSVVVVFNLVPEFLEATIRQYGFMLKGLAEVEKELRDYNIPFFLLTGKPVKNISVFLNKINAAILVTDFDPLKIKRQWKEEISKKISIPAYDVDAHNIVPCRYVSDKMEFAARTIRPKIHKTLDEFLVEYTEMERMKNPDIVSNDSVDWEKINSSININKDVKEVEWIIPGSSAAAKVMNDFINNRLEKYDDDRNDPVKDAQSNLSPYLHFGQISAQRVALEIKKSKSDNNSKEAFLEELIVRKELADNFCFYNKEYDSFNGFPDWAKKTLIDHSNDKREYIYTLEQFEKAETHEDLWNAAQKELMSSGKMHGYMRMYWGKKILEWSKTPFEALDIAIYLNDKYELDGRDPNGYTGCAWAIGGVHDRPWQERNIFGKIRYMNRNGASRKFDVDAYIEKVEKGSKKL